MGGTPGEPDSAKIKADSSAFPVIFGEGLGFFPSSVSQMIFLFAFWSVFMNWITKLIESEMNFVQEVKVFYEIKLP